MAPTATVTETTAFEHLVLDFLAELEFERGLSRNTLEAYRSDLLQFGQWLERAGADATEAQHTQLAGFLSELASVHHRRPPGPPPPPPPPPPPGRPPPRGPPPRAAPATLQRKAACLRSFYRHLRREQL